MTFWILVGIVFTLVFFGRWRKRWGKNSPPGPLGLPFLGNILQLDRFQHVSFGKWATKFGPIYQIQLANKKMIVVSDYKMVKEMFSQSVFSGRLDFSLFDVVMDGKVHGIIGTEGQTWEELRHFTLRQLRDFGFGKNTMEDTIMTEVNELIETLVELNECPVTNVKDRLLLAVVNSLWFIVTGTRHKQGDPQLTNLMDQSNKFFGEMLESGGLLLFAPWYAKWFPKFSGYLRIKSIFLEFVDMFRIPIEEHIKTYSEDYQRDFIDAYLKESYAIKNQDSAFYGKLGLEHLLGILGDFHFAGSDTTATSLSWMLLYLSKNREIQERLQAEIESVTGNTRPCSVTDRPQLPYAEAVIAETLRFSSIASVGVQHKALSDAEFRGYHIAKDTLITPNLYYIHHDPEIWGDPETFRPERFLSSDGKSFKKHEALMPFVVGRRQCLGESLARDSLFLFSTNIFQRFRIEFDRNGPDHGLESEVLFLLSPKPFHLIFKDRLK